MLISSQNTKYIFLHDNENAILRMKLICEVATAFLFSLYLYKHFTPPYANQFSIEHFIVVPLLHCLSMTLSLPTASFHCPLVHPALILQTLTQCNVQYGELKESFPGISKCDVQLATGFLHISEYPKCCFTAFAAESSVLSYKK